MNATKTTAQTEIQPHRGPGLRAEEIFRDQHLRHGLPVVGELKDLRQHACGYDFEIVTPHGPIAVEVKGLAGETGGVTFTDKEWRVAGERGDSYYLVVVRGVADDPRTEFIRNPAANFEPVMRAYTIVQIGWSVGDAALRNAAHLRS